MKILLPFLVAATFLSACSKRDVVKWMDKHSRCDLANQTSTYYGDKEPIVRQHFDKTYYANGLTKTLNIIFTGIFDHKDTLRCSFDYSLNAALVHVQLTERGDAPVTYDLPVVFDPKTGYATKVGDDAVVYEGKRMKSFGSRQFFYDNAGNLIAIKKTAGVGQRSESDLRLTYDLTKKGGAQEFYSTLDYNLGPNFSLADVMGWVPTSGGPNRRLSKEHLAGDMVLAGESYSDHQYKDGRLLAFKLLYRGAMPYDALDITNTWKCK